MDTRRRTLLTTGAAAAAVAAAPRAFAQRQGETGMAFYEKGNVRIRYEDVGSGFPLLLIPGGGLNSNIEWNAKSAPFNAVQEFKSEYRCITADMRNAAGGKSSGPLDVERPWDAHTDDQLAVMDQLGIKKFMVLGFCIAGPFIWNLIKRAPDRVVAGVLAQPSGFRKEMPNLSFETNMKGWGPDLVKRRPDITMDMVERFLTRMYRNNPDFVWTDAGLRAFMPDTRARFAGRLAAAPLRCRHGIRHACAEVGSQSLPVEGSGRQNSGHRASGSLVPARASTGDSLMR